MGYYVASFWKYINIQMLYSGFATGIIIGIYKVEKSCSDENWIVCGKAFLEKEN